MMKRTISLPLLLVAAAYTYAAVQTPFRGHNDAGETVVAEEVYWDKNVQAPSNWTITIIVDKKVKHTFEKQSCSTDGKTFSCTKDGMSPLAGATYAVKERLEECRGTLFVCKDGCGVRAPREMIEEPYECGEAY